MAPKRFKKVDTNQENGEKYKNLIISDVLCPICRSIFIEPVTLPCNHGFCLACFNGTMENTTLTCPLCRIRIGSWLRSARKDNKIINGVLWRIIQLKFSKEIRKKLEGDDISLEEKVPIKLANPGEIRREYELQLERERSEIQKRRDSETKASEIVIKKLLEEEQNAAKIEEEKLRLDEEVARRLAADQEKAGPSSCQSQTTPKSSKISSIDRYLIALSKKKQEPEGSKSKIETDVSTSKHESKSKLFEISPTAKIVKPELITPPKTSVKGNTSVLCQKIGAKQQCSKAYQHLLLTKTLHYERADSGSDSGDSIKQEMRYFKPIRLAPTAEFRGDANSSLPLRKITPIVAKTSTSVKIRSPQSSLLVRIGAHPGSAFVSCSPETNKSPLKVKKPSVVSDSGKVVKQYYNRKRNTLPCTFQLCAVSPVTSPCFGFEIQSEQKYATIMRDLVSTMSEHVNRCVARNSDSKNVLKEVPRQNLSLPETRANKRNSNSQKSLELTPKKLLESTPKKLLESTPKKLLESTPKKGLDLSPKKSLGISQKKSLRLTPKKLNGCDTTTVVDVSNDANLQEKLDLEYAKRLHEELNNPRSRQTRASIQPKKPAGKTRSSPRKRQVTLDELITPKKFKI